MTLTATVSHHSISRHYEIAVGNDVAEAKKLADAQFGDGFIDHTIVITNARGEVVAARRIADDGWGDED